MDISVSSYEFRSTSDSWNAFVVSVSVVNATLVFMGGSRFIGLRRCISQAVYRMDVLLQLAESGYLYGPAFPRGVAKFYNLGW